MQKQLCGDLSYKVRLWDGKGWLNSLLATDWLQFPTLRHHHRICQGHAAEPWAAFRWNYSWTKIQEKSEGNLEKSPIWRSWSEHSSHSSAQSGKRKSTSEPWDGMSAGTLSWTSPSSWTCAAVSALLQDRKSPFGHIFKTWQGAKWHKNNSKDRENVLQ